MIVKVARKVVDVAIGGDQGGSIRIPASWCGIVGLKPTYGLVPYTGIMPIEKTIDHAGPMARTVEDCAALLEVKCEVLFSFTYEKLDTSTLRFFKLAPGDKIPLPLFLLPQEEIFRDTSPKKCRVLIVFILRKLSHLHQKVLLNYLTGQCDRKCN